VAASFLNQFLKNPTAGWVLRNSRNQHTLATTIEPAFDSPGRRKGLLGRSSLPDGHAIILAPCNSIHTFFMQFPIDVLFVSRDGRVIKICRDVHAWRVRFGLRAFAVAEFPSGVADRTDTRVADILQLVSE
jgi:uncharacterized membrane protein (UPF0127 family)